MATNATVYAVVDRDGYCGDWRRVYSVHRTAKAARRAARGHVGLMAVERSTARRGERISRATTLREV